MRDGENEKRITGNISETESFVDHPNDGSPASGDGGGGAGVIKSIMQMVPKEDLPCPG